MATGDPYLNVSLASQSLQSGILGGVTSVTSSAGNGIFIDNSTYPTSTQWYPQYGPYYTPPPPVQTPIIIEQPRDEIKSPVKEEEKDGHELQATMRISGNEVVVEYFCIHCEAVIYKEVVSKIPKEVLKNKCLPRVVKEVK